MECWKCLMLTRCEDELLSEIKFMIVLVYKMCTWFTFRVFLDLKSEQILLHPTLLFNAIASFDGPCPLLPSPYYKLSNFNNFPCWLLLGVIPIGPLYCRNCRCKEETTIQRTHCYRVCFLGECEYTASYLKNYSRLVRLRSVLLGWAGHECTRLHILYKSNW